MPRIYHLSKTGTRLLYKIRHHKGHGIHSPFVFNFITKVIEEKTPYYAYEDIRLFLEKFPNIVHSENKTNRLAFKTVNYFNAKNILELGAGDGISTLYLTSPSSDIKCISTELNPELYNKSYDLFGYWKRNIILTNEEFPKIADIPDCIYINLRNYQPDQSKLASYLLSNVGESSFIFIDGIRTNRKQQMLWRKLIENNKVVISLDLFHLGILFFDKKYHKRNYKLSF